MIKFEKKDPDKIAAKKKIVQDAKEASDDAVAAAQVCLESDLFTKYRIEYERLTEKVMDELIMVDQMETDPVKYGFQVKDIVSKLRHIGSLLRAVKQDAGRRI